MSIRISFVGDITCDRPMLAATKREDNTFNFEGSLSAVCRMLEGADYVVGNLETVFAGEAPGYNPGPITYNSPDQLLYEIKAAGIKMVTTANNHCLDCGIKGLNRTIEKLDAMGIDHTGTIVPDRLERRFIVREFEGIRVAFVSLGDSMNRRKNGTMHPAKNLERVNLLKSCHRDAKTTCKDIIKTILPMEAILKYRAGMNRKRGVPLVKVFTDDYDISERNLPAVHGAIEILKEARRQSDYVIACIHCGGQFNDEPGKYSVQIYDMLEPYADALIGTHPHVIQRSEVRDNKIRAYSLGSLNMSPSADYVTHEFLPEYSVLLNLFLTRDPEGNVVRKDTTFSFLLAQEDKRGFVSVRPVGKEQEQDVKKLYERFTGKKYSQWNESFYI